MLNLVDVRNRHFLAEVKRIIDSAAPGTVPDLQSVAARASLSPAPTYYCTYDYALRMLRVLRHGRLRLRRDRRYALWTELDAKASRIMERRGVSLPVALASVLSSGHASQFFISPSTALKLVYRYFDTNHKTILMP